MIVVFVFKGRMIGHIVMFELEDCNRCDCCCSIDCAVIVEDCCCHCYPSVMFPVRYRER
jgi:hypothetical protein